MTMEHAGPARSVWLQVLVLVALFLGGGALGVALAGRLAPDSWLAQFVGLFSFSVPFVIGLQSWVGFALATALWRTVTRGARSPMDRQREVPGGSVVFIPVCAGLVAFAGLLIGLFGSSIGMIATVGLYLVLGLGYGVACWMSARSGYLPFPPE